MFYSEELYFFFSCVKPSAKKKKKSGEEHVFLFVSAERNQNSPERKLECFSSYSEHEAVHFSLLWSK